MNHIADLNHHVFYEETRNGVTAALSAIVADDWLAADNVEVKSFVLENSVWLKLAP